MNTKTKLTILTALITLSVASPALADKLCLKTTVNRKSFKVTNSRVIAATCPKGFTELADTSSFQGPAGAQGAAGIVNLSACREVENTCNHSPGEVNICAVTCNSGEFRLQHSFTNAGSCNVELAGLVGPQYSNGVFAGATLFTYAECSYETTIGIVCCPLS